jgi:catalase
MRLSVKRGTTTDVMVRFSGVFNEVGDADCSRDLRGFAVKFYSTEGNYDMLCVNTPCFNVRDGKVRFFFVFCRQPVIVI